MATSTIPMSARADALRHIVSVTQSLRQKLCAEIGGVGDIDERHALSETPHFTLPLPINIDSKLLVSGASPELARSISDVFFRHAKELREHAEDRIVKSWIPISKTIPRSRARQLFDKLVDVHTQFMQERLDSWTKEALSRIQNPQAAIPPRDVSCTSDQPPRKKRQLFNFDYVPLLEHFFDENQFPSHADKVFLAKKTGMTFKQIHVWFQNRRNRTKKDGKQLRHKPSHEVSYLPLHNLVSRMGERIIPENERVETVESDNSDYMPQFDEDKECMPAKSIRRIHDVLDIPAPPHAFPSLYPPSCGYNPFDIKNATYRSAPPSWRRHPTASLLKSPSVLDISDLTERFSRLSVRDGALIQTKRSRNRTVKKGEIFSVLSTSSRQAATFAITTRPSPAPLPAFIPAAVTSLTLPVSRLPCVPAPTSRLHVFNTPSPPSRLATLVPLRNTSSNSGKRRKIAPLPKRIPKGSSIAHRGITPAMSEASVIPSLSLTSPSRTSSYGSSETRLFSETSSSSSSSPRVRTPATSSNSLPRIVTPTLSMPGFSPYQQPSSMSDLFADSPVRTPSQAEGLQLDTNFFGDPHIAKASDFDFFGISPSTNLVHAQS